jgi:hypothetical protein
MKLLLRPAVALLATFTFTFAAVPDETRKDLDKLVPEAVRLLETKEYATVLETLIPPDEFKKITAQMPLAEFASKFAERNAASLLSALKALKDKKPKLSDDGSKATFDLPEATGIPRKDMVFSKIEGRWYLN